VAEKERIIVSIEKDTLAFLPKETYEILDRVFTFSSPSSKSDSLPSIKRIEKLSDIFLSSIYEATAASNGALFLYDEKNQDFKCAKAIGLDPSEIGKVKFRKEDGSFWQVLDGEQQFLVENYFGNYHYVGELMFEPAIRNFGLDHRSPRAWVPLMARNKLIGVFNLGGKKDGSFYQEAELNFLIKMGNQAAIALENAMMSDEGQDEKGLKELSNKMASLCVLYDVNKGLNFTSDLKGIIAFILDKARDSVDAQNASLMLLDERTNELVVHAVRGVPPDIEAKISSGEIDCAKLKLAEGVAGKVAATKKYILINNASEDGRFKKDKGSFVNSILCMPLVINDKAIGVINLTNKTKGGCFTSEDVELLSTLTNQAAIAIYNARLYHLSITDGLTQLVIHRYFQQKLKEEIMRSEAFGKPVSLIMSDIDDFKEFNDTYGHQEGDTVLMETAKMFRLHTRAVDIVARYGGEEFAVILPETDIQEAYEIAENIRKKIEAHEYPSKQGKLKVTVSLGVATFPRCGGKKEVLIETADKALYVAKRAGKNRVEIAAPPA
jgi:diguanylate cyclase (GGDEF)-like protein